MIQIEFMDVGLEVEQWGTELREHLTGEAMAYWLYLYETRTNFKDWRAVKRMFVMRFCDNMKDEVLAKLADNVWQGNHARYSARFADVIAQGEAIPQEQLVEYYLASLPRELLLEVTKRGSIEFVTWQGAAMAVSKIEIPRNATLEKIQRAQLVSR